MSAKGYVINQITEIRDPDAFATYRDIATQTAAAHGGRFIVRGGTAERVEGAEPVGRVVVLEFPSLTAARDWYNSPEYQAGLDVRRACSDASTMIVEGAA